MEFSGDTNMTRSRGIVTSVLALYCCLLAGLASAQTTTTGALSGSVVDQSGGVLPGVTVDAIHQPTGTKYETVSSADGRFQLPNVRVGGPYTVTATLSGFKDQTLTDVSVALGETRSLDFKMPLATLTESVTVVGNAVAAQAGTAANISSNEIESLPTIQRSITDFARTNPFFNATTLGDNGDKSLSVAGRPNRYNNMQIDGAVNNDLFGLANSGTPGGQTGTQPISLDALDEVQLVVTPYDVKQGGFSGGGINVVTKSGGNAFSGTAYMFARNQGLIGKIPAIATVATPNPADIAVGTFTDKQSGFSIGGPIVHNKAFFFSNFDWARKNTPSGFSLDGTSGQQWNASDLALAQQALNIIQSQYGFNPGGLGQFSKPNKSNKAFVRTDFNLSDSNRLTARVNYVNSLNQVGSPTTFSYLLPSNFYSQQDKVLSVVGQLNSTLSNAASNEFRVTYQRDHLVRGTQPGFSPFPLVEVDFPDGNNIKFGTDNSSQANKIFQDIIEINDDVTWVKGKHTLSLGTHNELFKFEDLFIQNLFGNYRFSSVANLQAGLAQAFSDQFSNDPSQPLLTPQFSVRQYGVYAGDQWRIASNFTTTYGARFEKPQFPDTPHANPLAVADFNMRTDVVPSPKMFSPRIGFAWDLSNGGTGRSLVRGGVGSFAGRTPYVWLMNQYGNTGVDFTALSAANNAGNNIPFVANPNAQPTVITGALNSTTGSQNINLIDPKYKYPQILRGNLGYDRSLGFLGLVGTAEYVWSKTLEDILYKDLEFVPNGTLPAPDGRLTYARVDPKVNNAVLLTNATQGSTQSFAVKLQRPFRNGFQLSGSYFYNRARSISDGAAFTAATNLHDQYTTYDLNNPTLARSNYEAGNRVNLSGSVPIPLWKGLTSTASFFYNGQTGQPYSLLFSGDVNGDGNTFDDVAFLPSDPSQVVITNGTWAQLDAYLSSDSAAKNNRGKVPLRNTGTAPWSNDLDFRYAVNINTGGKTKVELTMDVFNLLNLVNKNWGWVFYPNFYDATTLGAGGIDPATGLTRMNLATITSPTFLGTLTRDDLRSRWQAQWGARFRF